MAHESFENEEIAQIMNDSFINIKVDREERPDIDYIYQKALSVLGEPGGWPLTMFLTPQGDPFWGGTYFPPTQRYGRPGFADVLSKIAQIYHQEPEKIRRNTTNIRKVLTKNTEPKKGDLIDISHIDTIVERIIRHVDPLYGGLGTAPKFPHCPIFDLLWRAWRRTQRKPFKQAVIHMLRHICQGGIYDHLGGGFARYATDNAWLVPHFEKMLYDNAQLLSLLTLVWQDTRSPLFESRVRETIQWVLREMLVTNLDQSQDDIAGFASSLDADSEGIEGKFYVWTEEEIDALLEDEAPIFKSAYGVTSAGNWEGKNILNQSHTIDHEHDDEASGYHDHPSLADMCLRLWEVRQRRIHPDWDNKVIADWNGLMISALATAGMVFDVPDWIKTAVRAFTFIKNHMMSEDGRLYHVWCQRPYHMALLDDYAHLCQAAITLYEVTGELHYLEQVQTWVTILNAHYWDHKNAGYFMTSDESDTLIVRTKHAYDNPTPSGNGVMIKVLACLYYVTGEDQFRHKAEALIKAFSGMLSKDFFSVATFLNNIEFLERAIHIIIVGDPMAPETDDLKRCIFDRCIPNRLVTVVPVDTALPLSHPAVGKERIEGRSTAYICTGMTCSLPVIDSQELSNQLDRLLHPH